MYPPNETPARHAVARGVPECDLVGTMIESESKRSSSPTQRACDHCGELFTARAAGRTQKFCSPVCRRKHHDAKPARAKRAQTCKAPEILSDVRTAHGTLLSDQPRVSFEFDADGGLYLTQHEDLRDDVTIYISADLLMTFLDRLTEVCGIPRFGG